MKRAFIAAALLALARPAAAAPYPAARLDACGSTIDVEFAEGHLELPRAALLAWVSRAACAVCTYFGRFPVARYRLRVAPVAGAEGVPGGTTWGAGGAHSRVQLGERATAAQLDADWVMTHEMVHLAFPDVGDEHAWIQEGIATYVEPLARSFIGAYPSEQVWRDLVEGLPKGEPAPGDAGLDHTHTWGRTYWGGAMFCALADGELRRRTHGRAGLIDALRGILAAGGNHEADWTLERALASGDKAAGAPVLEELYARMKDAPAPVDLDALWKKLGTRRDGSLDTRAPEAALRQAISAPPPDVKACSARVRALP